MFVMLFIYVSLFNYSFVYLFMGELTEIGKFIFAEGHLAPLYPPTTPPHPPPQRESREWHVRLVSNCFAWRSFKLTFIWADGSADGKVGLEEGERYNKLLLWFYRFGVFTRSEQRSLAQNGFSKLPFRTFCRVEYKQGGNGVFAAGRICAFTLSWPLHIIVCSPCFL